MGSTPTWRCARTDCPRHQPQQVRNEERARRAIVRHWEEVHDKEDRRD